MTRTHIASFLRSLKLPKDDPRAVRLAQLTIYSYRDCKQVLNYTDECHADPRRILDIATACNLCPVTLARGEWLRWRRETGGIIGA